jgi:tetratricopeptide (TPR) repeat protein
MAEDGKYPEAIAVFTKVLAVDPKSAEALKERAEAYTQEGNLDEALKDLNQAVSLSPQDPWGYFKRGMVKFSLGDFQEAVGDMTRAIEINPEGPLFYFARGQIYLHHLNDPDKGIADFREGCRLGHPLCCRELEKFPPEPKKQ